MNTEDDEELRVVVESCALSFGPANELRLAAPSGEPLMSWELSAIVDALLDLMSTENERDDALSLARLFESLSKRIRRTIEDIEG